MEVVTCGMPSYSVASVYTSGYVTHVFLYSASSNITHDDASSVCPPSQLVFNNNLINFKQCNIAHVMQPHSQYAQHLILSSESASASFALGMGIQKQNSNQTFSMNIFRYG